jgi:hypothetical protein
MTTLQLSQLLIITYNFPIYEKNPSNPIITIQKLHRHQKLASAIY